MKDYVVAKPPGGLRVRPHARERKSMVGRPPLPPLEATIVRPLAKGELEGLDVSVAQPPPPISRIRFIHHRVAELVVQGKSDVEVSGLTGMSPGWIWNLRNKDPAFRELMAHYEIERQVVNVEVWERMRVLGLSTLEELQSRLDAEPDKWSNRELMELVETMLVKGIGRQGAEGAPAGGGVPTLKIEFVTPQGCAPVIEVDPAK